MAPPAPDAPDDGLDASTRTELVEMAVGLGITVGANDSKAKIIAAIRAAKV